MANMKEDGSSKKKARLNFAGIADSAKGIFSDVSDKSKEIMTSVMDQNEDGKIDLDDFARVRDKAQKLAKEGVKYTSENIKSGVQALDESRLERSRKSLRPVFAEELEHLMQETQSFLSAQSDHAYKMIHVVERDKKREEHVVSKGAIGYWTVSKDVEVLNLYEDYAKNLDIQFFPNFNRSIYYIDPFKQNAYIDIDHYFKHMKNARVAELEMIASALGAKKVKITLKEFKSSVETQSKKFNAKFLDVLSSTASTDRRKEDIVNMEIAADLSFTGHDTPRVPELVYFKGEKDIEQLIALRTDPNNLNQILSKTYALQYNKSSGMKTSAAAQIDAAVKALKVNVNSSLRSEAQRETNTILEYHIEF